MASTLFRLGAALCLPLALAVSGCGMNVQTLQPYTPAQGVNQNVGQVMVRNLVVIADTTGRGVVSASLVSYADDTLSAVAGVPQKSDGTAGSPLVVTTTGIPLTVTANTLFVLTLPPVRISVTSPDLKPGLLAEVTLTFAKAGPLKAMAPVVSSEQPEYTGIRVG